jgi:hypothetical protein
VRALALVILAASISLALASLGRAQLGRARIGPAQPPPTREARLLDAGPVVVRTEWSESLGRRSARVTATLGGEDVVMHDGATVRTAIAATADALLVVAWHGGDRPFVRARVARVIAGRLVVQPVLELSRSIAESTSRGLRPAIAIAAPGPSGLTILVQEQIPGAPQSDVVTTLSRVSTAGELLEAPRAVPLPWALGALAWTGDRYLLAVLYGGGSPAGEARICLVTLSPAGAPEQHPWWATPSLPIGEIQMVPRPDGTVDVVWSAGGQDRAVRAHTHRAPLAWGSEPPPPRVLGEVAIGAPYAAVPAPGGVGLVTP